MGCLIAEITEVVDVGDTVDDGVVALLTSLSFVSCCTCLEESALSLVLIYAEA